jgi:hypothetical protein
MKFSSRNVSHFLSGGGSLGGSVGGFVATLPAGPFFCSEGLEFSFFSMLLAFLNA